VLCAEGGAIRLAHPIDLVEEQARRYDIGARISRQRGLRLASSRDSWAGFGRSVNDEQQQVTPQSASASVDRKRRNEIVRAGFPDEPDGCPKSATRGLVSGCRAAHRSCRAFAKSLCPRPVPGCP